MKKKHQIWLAIGALVLIALLLIWLTFAFLAGDTDVSAQALPLANSISFA